jgi:hypothetical protein
MDEFDEDTSIGQLQKRIVRIKPTLEIFITQLEAEIALLELIISFSHHPHFGSEDIYAMRVAL